jgi:hypothetical protein
MTSNCSPSSACNEYVVDKLSFEHLQDHDLAPGVTDCEVVDWAFGVKVDMVHALVHYLVAGIILLFILLLFVLQFSWLTDFLVDFGLGRGQHWLLQQLLDAFNDLYSMQSNAYPQVNL